MSERYAKKISLYAQTPSGDIVTRKTDRRYAFVSLIFINPGQSTFYKLGWNVVSWHETEKAAMTKTNVMIKYFPQTAIVPVTETPTFKPVSAFSEGGRGWITTENDGAKVRITKMSPDFKVTAVRLVLPTIALLYVKGLIDNAGYKMQADGAHIISPVSTFGA